MKKKLIFYLIIIFLFLIPINQKIYGVNNLLDNLTKIEDNPLIFDTSQITDNNRLAPFVLYENNRFTMLYSSIENQKIAIASSNNGINWKIEKLIDPIDNLIEESPALIKSENGYRLSFSATPGLGIEIYEVELDSNFNPKQETLKKILKRGDYNWDLGSVADSFIFLDDNKSYLFYTAYGDDRWRLGLAILNEQNNWIKCPQPLISYSEYGGGPHVFKNEGKIYLVYHSAYYQGIKYVETDQPLSCNTQWSYPKTILVRDKTYDTRHITSPSILFYNNILLLYYSGLGDQWNINLASSNPNFYKTKIFPILLPGLFASWNKEALVYNKPVNQENWQLNPIVKEYSGLVQTFKNIGLQENIDFYFFNYDWRKSLNQSADDLHQFLNKIKSENQSNQIKFNLVGHSLGGMLSRIYGQKYGLNDINQIITVGSPHQGTAQVYKALEAGEIETPNNIQWLIFKLILQIYKDGVKTDRQIINEKIPVIKDLLATYQFLKDQGGNPIPVESLTIKNNLLLEYNQTLPEIIPYLYTISGKSFPTLFGYQIGPRTIFDQIMDYYPDGRPVNQIYNDGDGTVLHSSSQISNHFNDYNLTHGEIIYKKDPIKKILEQLNLDYQESQVQEGAGTQTNPSMIFLLLSPATMSVTLPDNSTVTDQDGLLFLENPPTGNYQLKIIGSGTGQYQVIIGQITENGQSWNTIKNETQPEKEDNYLIEFDNQKPKDFFVDEINPSKLKENLINEIKAINNPPSNNLNAAIKKLSKFKKLIDLLVVHKHLFNSLKEIDQSRWSSLLSIVDKFENYYDLVTKKAKENRYFQKVEIKLVEKMLALIEKKLIRWKNEGKNLNYQLNFYQLAVKKFNQAKDNYQQKNYSLSRILLRSVEELITQIKP